jgi:ATP-dependent helicase/nuclease subunit A
MSGLVVPEDTRRAQAIAAEPSLSAWVSANAGSGKTHVLAQRVIRLLLGGADPSRILCLTYTRAAAANMSGRVFRNLSRWATLPDEELALEIAALEGRAPDAERMAFARRLFARALETPGGLKIQTIHAFCEAVLHQFPLEANIAGHFEMLDSQMEAALLAEARREMIANAAAGADMGVGADGPALADAFATVLALAGESGLEQLLSAVIANRDALRGFIAEIGRGEPRFLPLWRAFGFSGDETPQALAGDLWPDRYFTAVLAAEMGRRAASAGKATAQDFAAGLAAAARLTDPVERLSALRGLFLTRKAGEGWIARSTRNLMAKGVGEFFSDLPQEFERFATEINTVSDRIALHAMLSGTCAALTLADWLIVRYERLKSARGFLDFNDLITRTVALLSRRDAGPWVQYKLDKGIDHILLDEAQDTSPDQWAVVRALTDEFFAGRGARGGQARTVFAVGDEKQSIYSFQGAEPEAFALGGRFFRERVTAAEARFEHVRLARSFRSTWDVLSAVDLVFANEHNRDGLTRDPEPIEHRAIRDAAPGHVEVWPSLSPVSVEEPDDWSQAIDHASAPAMRLAAQIAATIRHWLASGERIGERQRLLAAGDIMVLVRKRDRFIHALSRELKNLGIPVAGADRLLLTGHIAVQDLLAIARISLQPDDDLSLAALLKSPAFAFSEDELLALAAERQGSLRATLADAAQAGGKAGEAWATISRWRGEAGFGSPFAFFSAVLARDGLRRQFIARLGPEAGDVVDEFLNFCLAAEKTGTTELEALVALLDRGGPEIKREMDQTRGEVRIMTAHAAKGLEAPVVFLVDGGAAPFTASHLPRLMPFDPPAKAWQGRGFLWRAAADTANGFSAALEAEAKRKAEQEYRRLLYVGMTRAEDRLIVCGYHGVRGRRDDTWHAMVEAALKAAPATTEEAHPATGEAVLRYAVTAVKPVAPAAEEAQLPSAPLPPPAALHAPLPPAPVLPRPLAPSGAGAAIEPEADIAFSGRSPVLDATGDSSLALERGTALHRLIQMLPDIDADRRAEAARGYLGRIGRDWPESERERLWRSVEQVLADPVYAPLFAAGSRAEVAIMGRVAIGGVERAVSGKIDRLAVTGDAVLIVDFKTGRPPQSPDPARLSPSHVAQMALYRELVRPLYPDREIRAALVYTEAPVLVPLGDETLAQALRSLG